MMTTEFLFKDEQGREGERERERERERACGRGKNECI